MLLNTDSQPRTDLLKRELFAKEIASSLVKFYSNNSESIVFGLNGKWGSGKSTLLGYIVNEIQKEHTQLSIPYVILHFNPWMFSGQEQLQSIFLNNLASKLGNIQHAAKQKVKFWAKIVDHLEFLKYIFPGLGEGVKDLQKYLTKLSKEGPIEETKERINKIITDKDIRLYIIIDDIDRLTPPEVAEILQLIKLNANFKNTVYILALDKEVVQESLIEQYGNSGKRYIEKIIQVDYSIPEILDEAIEEIFFKELSMFFEHSNISYEIKELYDIWYHRGLKDYFTTLRDVYRFINGLRFRLPSIWQEINISDFLIIEAVRVFDYDAYKFVYKRYKKNTYNLKIRNTLTEADINEGIKNNASSELIQYLFRDDFATHLAHSTEKEISDPEYFETYFALKLSTKDISEAEFQDFIKNPAGRSTILEIVYKNGRLNSLLRKLANPKLKGQFKIKDKAIYGDLLDFWNNKERQFGESWALVWDALKNLAHLFDDYKKGVQLLIDEIITNYSTYSFARFYYSGLLLDNIQRAFKHEFYEIKDLVLENEEKIKKYFLSVLREWNTQYLSSPIKFDYTSEFSFHYFILKYAKHFPEDYKKRVEGYMKRQNDVLHLLKSLLLIDSTSKQPFRVEPKNIEILLPGEYKQIFVNFLKNINQERLQPTDRRNIQFYLNPE